VAFVLATAGLVSVQGISAPEAEAAVTWNTVTGVTAVWHGVWPSNTTQAGNPQNEWSRADIYTISHYGGSLSNGAQGVLVGRFKFDSNGEMNDWEPFLSLKNTGGPTVNLDDMDTFGVGPMRDDAGNVDRNNLVGYFWDYASDANSTPATCGTNLIPVWRVASGENAALQWACLPDPQTPGWEDQTGGEVDQRTGRIYVQSGTNIPIDGPARTSDARNATAFTISIWDPASGSMVSSSGAAGNLSIQPESLTERVKFQVSGANIRSGCDPAAAVAPCAGAYSPNTTSDMALDATGNIYMFAASDTGHGVIIRITPTRDNEGNITNASCASTSANTVGSTCSWKYTVVSHIINADSSTWDASGGGKVGSAFYNGSLFIGGYDGSPTTQSGGTCPAPRTQHTVLKADPLNNIGYGVCTATGFHTRGSGFPAGNTITSTGTSGMNVSDFASAQTAGVIEGKVYEDANGNGQIEDNEKTGVSGQKIYLYNDQNKLLSEATTDSNGGYYFMVGAGVEGEPTTYKVRLVQPHVNRGTDASPIYVNAIQTWANGGRYDAQGHDDPDDDSTFFWLNQTHPECWLGDDTATVERQEGGRCYGAKNPYDSPDKREAIGATGDPANWANYSIVELYTTGDVADADFGISVATGEWGDAPTGASNAIKTTYAQSGPYHINIPDIDSEHTGAWVKLGENIMQQNNGVNDTAANSSAHADDGVKVVLADGSKIDAQDVLLSVGRSYKWDATVQISDPIPGAPKTITDVLVKAWISSTTTSASSPNGLQTSTSTMPLNSAAESLEGSNVKGHVLSGNWTVPTASVSTSGSPVILRVNASVNGNITTPDNSSYQYGAQYTSTGTGSTTGQNNSWVTTGEIEDYRLWYTNGQVRVGLKTVGGTLTDQAFTLTNVAGGAFGTKPSSNADRITTSTPGEKKISNQGHIISNTSAATTITASAPASGWGLTEATCYNSEDNSAVTATVDLSARSVTLPSGTITSARNDITCLFTMSHIPSAARSSFALSANTAGAGGDIVGTVTVKDSTGSPLAGQVVQLSVDGTNSSNVKLYGDAEHTTVIATCTTESDGTCKVHITSTVAGTYGDGNTTGVHAKVDVNGTYTDVQGDGNTGNKSPQQVTFTAVPADASHSWFQIIESDASKTVGQRYTIKVTAKDTYGNAKEATQVTFSSTEPSVKFYATATSTTPITDCSTAADGTCTVYVTATDDGGPYDFHGKIGEVEIGGLWDDDGNAATPMVVDPTKASPQSKSFTPDVVSQTCEAGVTDCTRMTVDALTPVGQYANIVIILTDKYGNRITGKASSLGVTSSPTGGTISSFTEGTGADIGKYSGTITSEAANTYTVTSVPATGVTLTGTAQFQYGAVSAADSTFEVTPAGPLPVGTTSGSTYTATITAYDGVGTANGGRGNKIAGETVKFSVVKVVGGVEYTIDPTKTVLSSTSCTTESSGANIGSCPVTLTSTEAGTFRIKGFTSADVQIGTAEDRVYQAGAVDKAHSDLSVTPSVPILEDAEITVTLRDAYNNPVTGRAGSLGVTVTPNTSTFSGTTTFTEGQDGNGQPNGVYTATFTSSTATTYTVKAQPAPLNASDALTDTVEFTPIGASYTTSEFTVTPAGPLTVGTTSASEYTLKVTLKDSGGNLVGAGYSASFSADPPISGSNFTPADSCTTDGTSTCEVKVKTTVSGTYQLHAKIGTHDIEGGGTASLASPVQRVWNPETTFDPAHSSIVLDKASMKAGETAVATITLHDQYDNPITGYTSSQMHLLANPTGTSPNLSTFTGFAEVLDDQNNATGQYTVNFTSKTATAANGTTVSADPNNTSGNTADDLSTTMTVTAGALDPAHTTWSATTPVGVNAWSTATVTAQDQYGNPITDLTALNFSYPSSGGSPDYTQPFTALWDGMTNRTSGGYPDYTTDKASGQYHWNLRGSSVKTYYPAITVTKDGVTVKLQTYITVSQDPDIGSVSVDVLPPYTYPAEAEVSTRTNGQLVVRVTVTDAQDAPYYNLVASDFDWSPTDWAGSGKTFNSATDWLLKASSFHDNGDGTYDFTFASQRSGTYTVQVRVTGDSNSMLSDTTNAKFHAAAPVDPYGVQVDICPNAGTATYCPPTYDPTDFHSSDTTNDILQGYRGQMQIIVRLLDQWGNGINMTDTQMNNALSISGTGGSVLGTPSATDVNTQWTKEVDASGDPTGKYTALITGTIGTTYSYTVTLNSRSDYDRVTFINDPNIGSVDLTLAATTHEVCGGTQAGSCVQVIAAVKDGNDDPMVGLSASAFTWNSNPSAGTYINTVSSQWAPVSGTPGSYRSYIWATAANEYSVSVTVGGVTSDPKDIEFTAGPPCDPDLDPTCPNADVPNDKRTRVEVIRGLDHNDASAAVADGADKNKIDVYLFDGFGNPVAGRQIRTRVPNTADQTYLTIVGSATCTSDATGKCSFEYTSTAGSQRKVVAEWYNGSNWHTVSFTPQPGSTPPANYKSGQATGSDEWLWFKWNGLPPAGEGSSTLTVPTPGETNASTTATLVVQDANNQPITGIGPNLTLSAPGATPGLTNIATTPTESSPGTYVWTAKYSATAGTYQVRVTDTASNTTNSNNFVVKAPGFDPSQSSLVVTPATAAAGANNVEVRLIAKDADGNPVSGISGVLTYTPAGLATSPAIVGPVEDAANPGQYTWTGKALTAVGNYTETVKDSENHTVTAPFTIISGPPSPANSNLTRTPASQTVGDNVLVTATVKDANNNPVTGLSASDFVVTGTYTSGGEAGTPNVTGVFVTEQSPGVYYINLTSTKIGVFTISATVTGVTLTQTPTVTFTAGGVCSTGCINTDPDKKTRAVITKNGSKANGVETDEVTVYAFDTYGNPVANATVVATQDGGNSELSPTTVNGTTNTSGVYIVKWTTTVAGTYKAQIRVAGQTGFEGWAPQNITFNPLPDPDPARSTLTRSPASGDIAAGFSYTLTATVKDAMGNALTNQTVSFASDDPAVTFDMNTCNTNDVGVCSVDATSEKAGTFSVTGKVNVAGTQTNITGDGSAAQRSPKSLTWVAGDACVEPVDTNCSTDPTKKTRVEVTKNGQTANGSATDEATVYVFDRFGNPKAAAWSTSTTDPTLTIVTPSGTTSATTGQATISYTSTTAGGHTANVLIAGKTPDTSPISMSFISGNVASITYTVLPTSAQDVGVPFSIAVRATDGPAGTGNPVAGVDVNFNLPTGVTRVGGGAASCPTLSSGSCSISVVSTTAGSFPIAASSVIAVTPASQTLVWKAGAVDPANTTVTITKNGSRPNGSEQNVVTIVAKDQYGNPVSGAAVTSAKLNTGDDLTVVSPIPDTDATGTTTIRYTSSTPSTGSGYPASISVGGVAPTGGVGQPVNMAFSWTLLDPNRSSWTVTPDSPLKVGTSAANTYTVTVTGLDADGLPAGGATVTFAVSPSGPTWDSTTGYSCTTNASGVCSVKLYSTKSGTYSLSATSNGNPIGSAKAVAWSAEEVCDKDCTPVPGVDNDHKTRYEIITDNAKADNVTPDQVKVYAFDKYGNPVPNEPVGAAVLSPTDGAFRVASAIPATGADGTTIVNFYATRANQAPADAYTANLWIGPESDKKIPPNLPVSLRFTAGAGCASDDDNCPLPPVPNEQRTRLEITTNHSPADGTTQNVITAYVFDMYGNPVPDVQIQSYEGLRGSPTNPSTVTVGTIANTDADGKTTITYTSDSSGDHTITVLFMREGQWDEIKFKPKAGTTPPTNYSSSPATLTWDPGTVCISSATNLCSSDPSKRTRVEVTTDNQLSDGLAEDVVTVYLFDGNGNPVSGQTPTVTTTDTALTIGTVAATGTAGTTTAAIKSTKSGAHTVTVSVGGQEIKFYDGASAPYTVVDAKSSPATVNFTRPAVSVTNSTLSSAPASQTVGAPIRVTVTLKDANNQPISDFALSDIAVTGTYTSGGEAGTPNITATPVANEGNGVYTYDITSKKVGVFTLNGVVTGLTLTQHPTATFTAGGVCVTSCEGDSDHTTHADITKNGSKANGTETDEVTVYAFDTYGNKSPNQTVVATRVSTELTPATQTVTTNADGVAVVKWTSTTAGSFSAEITVGGLNGFPGWAPSTLSFSPLDDPSPTKSKLTVSPDGPITVGSSYTLTAEVRDANENLMSNQAVTFTASSPYVDISPSTCITISGVCPVTVTTTVAGSYTISGKINVAGTLTDIIGDNSAAQRSPKTLVWNPDSPCVAPTDTNCSTDPDKQSRIVVTTNGQQANGTAKDIATIYAFDRYGNPINGVAWAVAKQNSSDPFTIASAASGTTQSLGGTDGLARVEFTSGTAGTYNVTATIGGKTPATSPASISFTPGPVGTITASVTPAGPQAVGSSYVIGFEARDSGSNLVGNVPVSVTLPTGVTDIGGTSCNTGTSGTNQGKCSITVTSTKAGSYQIPITSTPAATPPYVTVVWEAGAVDPAKTTVAITKNGSRPNGEKDVVTVTAHDAYDNPIVGATVASTKVNAADDLVVGTIAATDSNGQSTIEYTSSTAGTYPANITVNGVTPTGGVGSPVSLSFQWAVVDLANSSWTVSPASPIKVGEGTANTYTATVTARDASNQPVGDATITFALSPATGPVWVNGEYTCTTNPSGVCDVKLYSTKSGTYLLTASVAAGTIPDSKSIAWSAEEICDKDCTPVPGVDNDHKTRYEVITNNAKADNATPDQIKVYAFDKYGNPVPNMPVGASTADVALRIQTGIPSTGTDGTAIVNFYSKTANPAPADTYKVQLWMGPDSDRKIPPSLPAELRFVAGGGCTAADPNCPDPSVPNDHRTRLEITTDHAKADGTTADVITAYVFDKYGNPVSTEVQSFGGTTTTPDSTVTVGTIANTDASGKTTINYTSTTSGAHTVTVMFKVDGAWEEIVFKPQPSTTPPANYVSSPATINFDSDAVCIPSATNVCSSDPSKRTHVEVTTDGQLSDGQAMDVVTVYLFDANGNPVVGKTPTSTKPDPLDDLTIVSPIAATGSAGTTTISYKSTTSGAHTARVLVDGQEIKFYDGASAPYTVVDAKSSPVTLNFARPDVSAANSSMTASPSSQTVGQPVRVVVTAKDANNQPISDLPSSAFTVTGAYTSGGEAGTSNITASFVSNEGAGVYYLDITSPAVGTFQLTGVVATVTLNQHPNITFTHGGVCVSNCDTTDPDKLTRAVVTKNGSKADGLQTDEVTVYAYDTYGNKVPGAAVKAIRDNNTALTPATVQGTTGADGTYVVKWTSTTAGTFAAQISVDNLTGFPGWAPSDIRFNPLDNPSEVTSTFTADPTTAITAGATYTLKVTVRDANNNLMDGQSVAFAASDPAVVLSASDCDTDDGVCTITATSEKSGTFQVTAKVNISGTLTDIVGDGTNAQKSPKNLTWNPGAVCVPPTDSGCSTDPDKQTRITVTKNSQVANGSDEDEATVYAFDRFGNPVTNVAWSVSTTDSALVIMNASGTTGSNGQSLVRFRSAFANTYSATATIAGKPAQGSPLSLSFIPGEVGSVTATVVDGGTAKTVGSNFELKFYATDGIAGAGNPVAGVSVTATLPANVTPVGVGPNSCSTNSTGYCSIFITSTKAGQYTIPVAGVPTPSPSSLGVEWKADSVSATNSTVEVVKNGSRPNGEQNVLKVTAKDQYGNPVVGATVASTKVNASDPMTIVSPIPVTDSSGVSQIQYTATQAGTYQTAITVDSVTPTGGVGSPVGLTFQWAVVDLSNSSWTISPASPLKVGTAAANTYTATVTARDSANMPAGDATITFALVPSAGPTWVDGAYTCTTNSSGVCHVDLYSTKSGTYSLSASAAAGTIPDAKSITWTAEEVCDKDCTPEPGVDGLHTTRYEIITNNATADNVAADVVKLYAFDKYGNPVPNQPVGASTTDLALRIQSGPAATASDGTSTISFYSKVAGNHEAQLWIGPSTDKKLPPNLPAVLNFTSGSVCVPGDPDCPDPTVPNDKRTRLEITTNGQLANGTAADVITVYAFDKYGNPVSTAVQSIGGTVADPDTTVTVGTIANTDATGKTTVNYTSTKSGDHQVTVMLEREGQWTEVIFEPKEGTTPPASYKSSPATINFLPGSATEGTSAIDIVKTSAEKLETSDVIVTLKDANGNVVSNPPAGTVVTLVVSGPDASISDQLTAANITLANSGATVKQTDGTFKGTVSGKEVGTIKLTFTLDGANGTNYDTMTVVDTTPPAAPSSAHQAQDSAGNNIVTNAPATDGEPGTTIEITWPDGTTSSGTVGSDGTWSVAVPPTMTTDGNATAVAKDPSGNTSSPVTVPLDVTPPASPAVTTANGDTIAGTAASDVDHVTVTYPKTGGGTGTVDVPVNPDGTWSVATPADAADGTLSVVAVDDAGNKSTPTTETLDVTDPPAPVITTANGDTIAGTAAGTDADHVTVTYPKTGGGTGTVDVPVNPDGTWSVATPADATDGTLSVVTVDDAGNASTPTTGTLDVTDPPAPVITTANGDEIAGTAAGTDADHVTVTYPKTGGGTGTVDVPIAADGTWSVDTPADATDGPISVVTVDDAGNASTPTTGTLDVTDPPAPAITTANGDTIAGTATGTDADHVTVTYPKTGGGTGTVDVPINPDGTWSVSTPADATDGPISVVTVDDAGNASTPTTGTLDVTDPPAPAITTANSDEIAGTATGSDADHVTVTYPKAGGGTGTVDVPINPDGTWSVSTPADATDGPISVVTVDDAGNASTPTTGTLDITPPSSPTVTTANGDTIAGTAPGTDVDHVTVTYPKTGGGTGTVDVPVNPDGTWSVATPADAADGTLSVVTVDDAGNVSTPTTKPLDVTDPPAPTVTTANGDEISGTAPGTDTDHVKVTYPKDGGGTGEITCPVTAGTYTCTTPADADDGTLTVVSVDEAGNESTPVTVPLDVTPPGAPSVTEANGEHIAGTAPGDDIDEVVVTYPKDGGGTGEIHVPVNPDGTYSVDTPADAADGPLTVVAVDEAGNESAPTTTTLDTTPPSSPTVDTANKDEISGSAPGDDVKEVVVTYPKEDGTTGTVTCPVTAGKFSCDTPADADDGTISVVAKDEAGNTSPAVTFPIDVTPPPSPTVDTVNGDEISGTAPGDDVDHVEVTYPKEDGTTGTIDCPVTAGKFKCDTPDDATNGTISVVTVDEAGNESDPVTKPLDVTPPSNPKVDVANKDEISGTAPGDDVDHVEITYPKDGGGTGKIDCPVSAGKFKCDTPADATDGDVKVAAVDDAGNKSGEVTFPIDVTPPSAPSNAHQDRDSNNKPVVTNDPAKDAEPGSTIVVTWPDGTTSESTVNPDGSWSVPIPDGMKDGDASVVVKDPAGNPSAAVKVPVDVTAPDKPTIEKADNTGISGKAEPESTVTITLPPGSTPTAVGDCKVGSVAGTLVCTVGKDGTWSYPGPLTDDIKSGVITVVATDKAGNVSPAATATLDNKVQSGTISGPESILVTTDQGEPVDVKVLGKYTTDATPLVIASYEQPDNGTVSFNPATTGLDVVNATGYLTYTPDDEFSGTDSFNVTMSNAKGTTKTVPVIVTVKATTQTNPSPSPTTTTVAPTGGDTVTTNSWWFAGLLGLLGLSVIVVAALLRRRRDEHN
jgi:hypothetical protein